MRRSVLLAVLVAVISSGAFAQDARAKAALEEGLQWKRANEFTKAAAAFSNLIANNPAWHAPYLQRALCRLSLADAAGALADLEVAARLAPGDGETHLAQGEALVAAGRSAEATAAYTRAIEAGLRQSTVYNGRAKAYAASGEWQKAVADYDEGIRLRLDAAEPYLERGKAKAQLNQPQDAIEDFGSAILNKPDLWPAYIERAQIYGQSGRFDAALADLDKVVANGAGDLHAFKLRGGANDVLGNLEAAIADYTTALGITPEDPGLLLARAAVYVRAKRYREALADRDHVVQLKPNDPEAYVARGGSYHLLGEHDRGLADRTKAIELDSKSGLAWAARGNAHFILGKRGEAAADLKEAVRLRPEDTASRELLERVERAIAQEKVALAPPKPLEEPKSALTADSILEIETPARNTAEAKAPVEPRAVPDPPEPVRPEPAAVEREPAPVQTALRTPMATAPPASSAPAAAAAAPSGTATAEGHHKMGREAIARSDWEEAIRHLNEALRLDPRHSLAANARGYVHLKLRNPLAAIEDFTIAIRLNPNYVNAYRNRAAARRSIGDAQGANEDTAKEQALSK